MPASLTGLTVAVIGGDRRQLAVAAAIAGLGGRVRTFALPESPDPEVIAATSLTEALQSAIAVVLPISGVGREGGVNTLPEQPVLRLTPEFWQTLSPGRLILTGSLPEAVKRLVADAHRLVEYAEIDEIAILNSIPTAEGTLQLALEELPITIHGCCCFILGLGRVGLTTARLFKAVGAETWVAANRPALKARAVEMGCETIGFCDLPGEIGRADLIINTVPALVLPKELLALTKPSVYLIDLASAPGGIDFDAAAALDRRAKLALGLPGKVAPESAGRILATTLPAIIQQVLAQAGR